MIKIIEQNHGRLRELCGRFCVKRLDVFGSAVSEKLFDQSRSDLDFLVEIESMEPVAHAKSYFGLLAELQDMFPCEIDLLEIRAVKNPYLLKSIEAARSQVYAA